MTPTEREEVGTLALVMFAGLLVLAALAWLSPTPKTAHGAVDTLLTGVSQ